MNTSTISIRLEAKEKHWLQEEAKRSNLSLSDYAKKKLLNTSMESQRVPVDVVQIMGKMSTNINILCYYYCDQDKKLKSLILGLREEMEKLCPILSL